MSVVTTSAGDDERRKAQVFIDRGNIVADTVNYDDAIQSRAPLIHDKSGCSTHG